MRSSRLLVVGMVVLLATAGIPSSVLAPVPSNAQQPLPPDTPQDDSGTIKHAINGDLSYLEINRSIERNDMVTVTQDAGSSVSLDTTKIQSEYERERIKTAHKNASDERAFATDELDTIETQRDELRKRQNDTIRKYNDGEISSEMLLRELALISTEAQRIQVMANYLTDVGNESLTHRANNINQELNMFQGPVRTRIQSALNGDPTAPNRFFLRTTSEGVVLATIDDSSDEATYVREAYFDGGRSSAEESTNFGEEYMSENVKQLYGIGEGYMDEELGAMSFYRYDLYPPEYASADDGRIRHYVDRGSGNIVFERQMITIDEQRTVEHEPQKSQNEQLALTQRTTFPGGYMYVRLTHPEGETRNGTISVDGEPVGTTDEDGLFMLQPPNRSTITATTGTENISVTVGNDSRQPPGPAGSDEQR